MKNITIRLNDEDLKRYESIKNEICADSPTAVIRYSLKKAHDVFTGVADTKDVVASAGVSKPIERPLAEIIKEERGVDTGDEVFCGYAVSLWKREAEGNDPVEGDWIGVALTVRPFTRLTLWSHDEGFNLF